MSKSSKSATTEHVSLFKASKMLGVTSRTIRNWDRDGKIRVLRTVSNYRVIPLSEIKRIQSAGNSEKKVIAYCRVSTQKQSNDLSRQIGRVLEYCNSNSWRVELIKDIGSGLNDRRKGFNKLITLIATGEISSVIVEHKDRLVRFGFSIFEEYCKQFTVSVIVLEDKANKSFEEELSEDLISIITCYSARLCGRRGSKK